MQWLNENDDVSLEYLKSAFIRDKKDGVSNDHIIMSHVQTNCILFLINSFVISK